MKIAAQKKVCFSANFALLAGFFGIGATIRIGREILCLPYAGFFLVKWNAEEGGWWNIPQTLIVSWILEISLIKQHQTFIALRLKH